jgi:hypothetical protein
VNAVCRDEEAIELVVLVVPWETARVLPVLSRPRQGEFQGEIFAEMHSEKRVGALLLLEGRHPPVQGGADKPGDPIEGQVRCR